MLRKGVTTLSTQIDSLSIKIESNSQNATAAIDQMTKALQQLKAAGGLGSIEKNIQKSANAVTKGMKNVPQQFQKASKAADSFAKSTGNAAANTEKLGGSLSGATSNLTSFIANAVFLPVLLRALVIRWTKHMPMCRSFRKRCTSMTRRSCSILQTLQPWREASVLQKVR